MTDKTLYQHDPKTGLWIPELFHDNGGGTYTRTAWGQVSNPSFAVQDSLTRPNNTTAYAAAQAINCNCLVTALAYAGLQVTLTAPNALAVGDRITVSGVNTGFTVTNVDGNWTCKTGTNATTIVFDVAVQPTGTTPQTITAGAVAKLLKLQIVDTNGEGAIISRFSVSLQGVAMTGAIRMYVYDAPTTVLVDQSTFTLLNANDTYRRDYYDLYPVTEGAGSDVTFASVRLWEVFKTETSDKNIYVRLVAEGAMTPVASAVITVRATGIKLQG